MVEHHGKFITREKREQHLADERRWKGPTLVRLLPVDQTPAFVKADAGVLVHRVRFAEEFVDRATGKVRHSVWSAWCGMSVLSFRGGPVEAPATVCHRCDDVAYLHGEGWSGLLPENACEATGGTRWRRTPPQETSRQS